MAKPKPVKPPTALEQRWVIAEAAIQRLISRYHKARKPHNLVCDIAYTRVGQILNHRACLLRDPPGSCELRRATILVVEGGNTVLAEYMRTNALGHSTVNTFQFPAHWLDMTDEPLLVELRDLMAEQAQARKAKEQIAKTQRIQELRAELAKLESQQPESQQPE